MLYVVLAVLIVTDVAEILLTVVLGTLQQTADLLTLGFVLAQEVHGLGQFEVDLAAVAGIAALGYLRVDLEAGLDGIRRDWGGLLLLEKEVLRSGEL